MKYIKVCISILILFVVIFFVLNPKEVVLDSKMQSILTSFNKSKYTYSLTNLKSFLFDKMCIDNVGVKTNYLKSNTFDEVASGHEVLSESMGLSLLLSLNDKEQFDETLNSLKENFMTKNSLIKWIVDSNGDAISSSNASIDDLRITRSLLFADKNWSIDYLSLALELASSLKEYNVEDGMLYDFYDGTSLTNSITFCYLDLYTMEKLTHFDAKWGEVFNNSLKSINKSLISESALFYKKDNQDNIIDNFFYEINMIEHLLTMLHLSEVNELPTKVYKLLVDEFNTQGYLPGRYSVLLNRICIAKNMESTAVYAIAAMIAEGESVIDRVEIVDRGYEDIENRLNSLGADIVRED